MLHQMRGWGWAIAQSSAVAFVLAIGVADGAIAQIVPDQTLGAESSRVTPNVQVRGDTGDRIEGGATRGANLFHSFRSFNVGDGQRVYFANPIGVSNIFSRVTGGNVSNILGTLGVEGGANLFLMNPNGIVFGQNARLDVSGSFLGTTSDRFNFADGSNFSASDTQALPLLTVSAPIGLQYGTNPAGAIAVNQSVLEVGSGRSLILAGGTVTLDGGTLATGGGQIELGGLADAGSIGLTSSGNQLMLNFPNQATRADVSIANGSAIGVVAGNGGSVAINARNLEILGGSRVVAGLQPGLSAAGSQVGDITLNCTGTIRLNQSTVANFVDAGAIGNAGDIRITAGSLSLNNGSILNTLSAGQGDSGNIVINARDRVSFDNSNAMSSIAPNARGRSGDIWITAGSLSLSNEASLNTSSLGQGDGGNITINAGNRVSINNGLLTSGVRTNAIGNAGDIRITTGILTFDGQKAVINASTSGQGDGGNIIINAGDRVSINNGSLVSLVLRNAIGNAGDIRITTNILTIDNGDLSTLTGGQGNAGNIVINVRDRASFSGTFDLSGNVDIQNQPRGGVIEAGLSEGVGQAGTIRITTGNLTLDRFIISSSTDGRGNGGNINFNVRDRLVINQSTISTDVIDNLPVGNQIIVVGNTIRRQGGNISIRTGSLEVTGLSLFSAGTSGFGDAGDVTIHARNQVTFDGGGRITGNRERQGGGISSTVAAGAVGQGGTIRINAESLSLTNGAGLRTNVREASRGLPAGNGDAGDIIINVWGNVELQAGRNNVPSDIRSNIESGAHGNGGNIRISADSVIVRNGSQLRTETSGRGNAGDIIIRARDRVAFQGSNQTFPSAAFSTVSAGGNGRGGDIQIDSDTLFITDGAKLAALIERGSETLPAGRGRAGNVIINARDQVTVSGSTDPQAPLTFIRSGLDSDATGRAGDVRINTGSLTVTNGAQISSGTNGQGNSGQIIINVRDRVTLDGNGRSSDGDRFPSGIFSNVERTGQGQGGAIQLNTNTLSITRGAGITAGTRGRGDAGQVTINASDRISLDGSRTPGTPEGRSRFPSGIFSNVGRTGQGQGGAIQLNTNTLSITRGATINANTRGRGDAGQVTIDASDRISIDGSLLNENGRRAPSGIFSTTQNRGRNGGDIRITTDALTLSDRGTVNVRSLGSGDAGNITLDARTLQLDRGRITTESSTSDGGNITLQNADLLTLQNQSQITAEAGDRRNGGNGGNINLDVGLIATTPTQNSDISANAFAGRGGNIQITNNQGIFGIAPRDQASPQTSDITFSSTLGTDGTFTINQPDVDPSRGLVELPTTPIDATNRIASACPTNTQEADRLGSFIVSGRGGLPPSPTDLLSNDNVLTDWVMPNPQASHTVIESPAATSKAAIVEAQGWVKEANGEIRLVAEDPSASPALNPHCVRSTP